MLRMMSGIILGYLVFALSAFALFRVTHHGPHVPASIGFEISAIAYGMFFAFLAGYWGTGIGGRGDMLVSSVIAAIMLIGAIASIAARGMGWSPFAAIIFMVPAELVGGYVYIWKERQR